MTLISTELTLNSNMSLEIASFRDKKLQTFFYLSPPQRPLNCYGEAGEKEKESARGTMGRGKREERPLPYNVRFSGQICGCLTVAKPGEDLRDFECSFKDLSLEG